MPYKDKEKANEVSRRYYATHKEQHKARTHKYYMEHREELLKATEEWAKNNPEKRSKIDKRWKDKNRSRLNNDAKLFRKNLRMRVIDLLGGKCSNPDCPIPPEKMDKRALQIDHINGGGTQHRKTLRTWQLEKIILKKIELREPIKEYQLLCAYCNWMKRYEKQEWKKAKTVFKSL